MGNKEFLRTLTCRNETRPKSPLLASRGSLRDGNGHGPHVPAHGGIYWGAALHPSWVSQPTTGPCTPRADPTRFHPQNPKIALFLGAAWVCWSPGSVWSLGGVQWGTGSGGSAGLSPVGAGWNTGHGPVARTWLCCAGALLARGVAAPAPSCKGSPERHVWLVVSEMGFLRA